MLAKKKITIEHKLDAFVSQILVMDPSHIVIFFSNRNSYLLCNTIKQTIVQQIKIRAPIYKAAYYNPQQILIHIPSQNTIQSIDMFTGNPISKTIYFQSQCIPELITLLPSFCLSHHIGAQKRHLQIYSPDFQLQRKTDMKKIIQNYNLSTLVSFTQTFRSTLSFSLINTETQQQFVTKFDMQEKILMKIIEKNENEAFVVYLQNNITFFKALNLKSLQINDIVKIQQRLLDVIVYDPERELLILRLWQNWRPELLDPDYKLQVFKGFQKIQSNSVSLQNKNNFSNVIKQEKTYVFTLYNMFADRRKCEIEMYLVHRPRNAILDIMTKSGVIGKYGEAIVKKVLSIMDYY